MTNNPYQTLPTELHSADDLKKLTAGLSLALANLGIDSVICLDAGSFGTHAVIIAQNDLPAMITAINQEADAYLAPPEWDPYDEE